MSLGKAEESLEEIIVVGTRRTGRTEANTPVPVDVLNRADLCHAVGDTDFECI